MTTDLLTVASGGSLGTVVDYLSSGTAHSVLVVNNDGTLEGIVTTSDLIRQLGELL